MDGVEKVSSTLCKLELYDNQLIKISGLDMMSRLTILDISFNSIRDMSPVQAVAATLEELYIAQNKIRSISGLKGMHKLRILDLGANRIRVRLIYYSCFSCNML